MNKSLFLIFFKLSLLFTTQCYSISLEKGEDMFKQKENYCNYIGAYISKIAAINDVNYFFNKLSNVHPDPLQIEILDSLKSSIILSLPDTISKYEFWRKLAFTIHPYLDEHTKFDIYIDRDFNRIFPKQVFIEEGNFYYENNKKIISINNLDIRDIITEVTRIISGQNFNTKISVFQKYFPLFLEVYFKLKPPFNVEYELDNKKGVERLNGIEVKEYLNNLSPVSYCKIINTSEKRAMYIKYDDFENIEDVKSLTNEAFKKIENNKIENVIIDLRNNGGGTSECVDFIESFLFNGKYNIEKNIIRNSIDFRLKHKPDNHFDLFFNKYLFELFIMRKKFIKLKNIRNNSFKSVYKGEIVVLVSNYTASCAVDFAYRIMRNKRGFVIGDGIAQPIIGYTNTLSFKLPNSGLKFGIACNKYEYEKVRVNKGYMLLDYYINEKEFGNWANFSENDNDSMLIKILLDISPK